MYQHDPQHTGRSPYIGPGSSGVPDIRTLIQGQDGDFIYTPLIGPNDTLYLPAKINGQSGVYAYDRDGTKKWFYPANLAWIGIHANLLALTPEGDVFFCVDVSNGIDLITLRPDGSIKWQSSIIETHLASYPSITNEGIIYLLVNSSVEASGKLLAVDSTSGAIIWEHSFNGYISQNSLVVDHYGNIYFGCDDTLYVVNPDGSEKWKRQFIPRCQYYTCNPEIGHPSIGEDGTIYFVVTQEEDWQTPTNQGSSSCFHAIDPENLGQDKWAEICDHRFGTAPPAISPSDNLFFAGGYSSATWSACLFGFNSQGGNLANWPLCNVASSFGGPILIDGHGIIYVFFNNSVKAYSQEGEEKFSLNLNFGGCCSGGSPLSMDSKGTLYAAYRKNLYAISPSPTRNWSFSTDFEYNLDNDFNTVEGEGHLYGTATLSALELSVQGRITFFGTLTSLNPDIYLISTNGDGKTNSARVLNSSEFNYMEVEPNSFTFTVSILKPTIPINDGHYEIWVRLPGSYDMFVNTASQINPHYLPMVSPPGTIPVASFVYSPEKPEAGHEIFFDASASYDPDGDAISFGWDWDYDGDIDEYSDIPKTTFWWEEPGEHKVGLVAADSSGNISYLYKNIQVGQSAQGREAAVLAGIFDFIHPWWWKHHKDFKTIDSWLRRFEPRSKRLSWLKNTDFWWCTEEDVVYIFDKEIDSQDAPGLTYNIFALCKLQEEDLVESGIKEVTPTYLFLGEPLFKFAFGAAQGVGLSITEGGISELLPRVGFGLRCVSLISKLISIHDAFEEVKRKAYVEAFGTYFRNRHESRDTHEQAWDSAVEKLMDFVMSPNVSDEEKNKILDETKDYFENIYNEYCIEEYISVNLREGLTEEFQRSNTKRLKEFFIDGLTTYKNELPSRKKVWLSGCTLSVFDANGHVTGFVNNQQTEEIPNSIYDHNTESIVIFLPDVNYDYVVRGTDSSPYKLKIVSHSNTNTTSFRGERIPLETNVTHRYIIDWETISQGEDGVTVRIDRNDDNNVDQIVVSDANLVGYELAIDPIGYEIVEQKRIARTEFEYVLRLRIANHGLWGLKNISMRLAKVPANTVVLNDTVTFSSIESGQTALSDTTFKIRTDRSVEGQSSQIIWKVVNCAEPVKEDFNYNWQVDIDDLTRLGEKWLLEENDILEDLYEDGLINFRDFAVFAESWLNQK